MADDVEKVEVEERVEKTPEQEPTDDFASALRDASTEGDAAPETAPEDDGKEKAEEKPEEKAEPEKEDATPEVGGEIDEAIVSRGLELGFSDEEIADLATSPKWVQEQIFRRHEAAAKDTPDGDENLDAETNAPATKEEPAKAEKPTPTPKTEEPPIPWEELENEENGYDPVLVKALKAAHQKIDRYEAALPKIEAMQERFAEWDQQRAAEYQSAAFAEFDKQLNELPEEWKEVLGTEPTKNVFEAGEKSKHYQSRVEIAVAMQTISQRREDAGMAPLDDAGLFRAALRLAFPEKDDAIRKTKIEGQIKNKLRDAKGKFLARPTSRNSTPLSPSEDFRQSLVASLKE